MSEVAYTSNQADRQEILAHFLSCDPEFIRELSDKVKLEDYVDKILSRAKRYEAWKGGTLIGLVAVYNNKDFDFITNVSVSFADKGQGIASRLLKEYLKITKGNIKLEVSRDNSAAHQLYAKFGFQIYDSNEKSHFMNLCLE